MTLGQRFAAMVVIVPVCALLLLFSKLYEPVQYALAGAQFAYAGLTLGLSALAAVGLWFLLRAPDSWFRRIAAGVLVSLAFVPPMFGCLAFVFALAQVLHNPHEVGDSILALVLCFFWEMALMAPLLLDIERRQSGQRR